MSAVRYVFDRSLRVPRDRIVRTAWVPLDRIRHACTTPMSTADAERSRELLLQNRDEQGRPFGMFPCGIGEWDGDTFVLHDGRHERIGRLLLGDDAMLVAWMEAA